MIYCKELEKLANMIKKYSSLFKTKNSPIFYLILITLIYFTYVLKITNIDGDWRHYIDSEILWPYNVLLILSDREVDFSAYGYFYFILEYKFFQILDLFGFLKTTSIEELNNTKNFAEKLENLIGLEIELVYEWEVGSMLIFDRSHLHCSSSVIDGKKVGLTTFTKK